MERRIILSKCFLVLLIIWGNLPGQVAPTFHSTDVGTIEPVDLATAHFHYLEVDSALKVGDSSIYIVHSNQSMPYNQLYATNGPLYINLSPANPENTLINSQSGQVGIGYFNANLPAGAKFSVFGNSQFSGYNAVNRATAMGMRLGITANSNETGLLVDHLQTTPWGIAMRGIVSHPVTKAFGIVLSDNNPATPNDPESFLVMGNGVTNIGQGVSAQLVAQLNVETNLDVGCKVKSTHLGVGKTAFLAEVPRQDAQGFSVVYDDYNPATVNPKTFTVLGNGITNITGLGGTGQTSSQLYVETGLDVGCKVKSTGSSPNSNQVAILAEVPFLQNRAISVVTTAPNYPSPREVFRVTGGGVAWMQELRVRVAPFPDYVFEAGYALMDLDSLERFVFENHRLPGMPSAKEIEESDANVGELLRLQQEKIEELVLYVIELRKELSILINSKR